MQVIWRGKQGKTEGALSGERGKVKIGVCILTLRCSALLCHLERGKATLFETAMEDHVLHLPKTTNGFVYIALGVMMLPPSELYTNKVLSTRPKKPPFKLWVRESK